MKSFWSFMDINNTVSTEICLQLINSSLRYLLNLQSGTCFKRNYSASHEISN